MRGKDLFNCAYDFLCGITPARAGKRDYLDKLPMLCRDHPRACGEKGKALPILLHRSGSPPRVRGKEGRAHDNALGGGITPARAGKSVNYLLIDVQNRDHPRACGEKGRQCNYPACAEGSPPRVRGKVYRDPTLGIDFGITPARAGKSNLRHGLRLCYRDHPRACGEKCCQCKCRPQHPGSPPRVRGKVAAIDFDIIAVGITPARAGKRVIKLTPPVRL